MVLWLTVPLALFNFWRYCKYRSVDAQQRALRCM
jgi:hypothetical protein